ncbi:hypothetical protein QYM36_018290 [Artemia franciscana]|uniref:Endonuclease/exonuclease/phosphatase domain-containing protein n=1 Tax=Artemia franciscana TaxID=6661 RepID=A0AA88H2L3_ARTSF|nr:hypothetical protein QYM36_018290 [Artemia franciscana]
MFVLSSIYRSPSSLRQLSSQIAIAEMMQFILCNFPKATLLMTGDFNLPNMFWIDGQGMTMPSLQQNPLIQVLAHNFLYQTVTVPTRMCPGQNPSTLDLVITNDPERVIRTQTLSLIGSSDHMPVLSSIQLNSKPSKYTKQSLIYKKYKIARNLLRKETQKLTVNYKKHLAKIAKENPKLFWKHISLCKPGRYSVPDLENNSSVSSCASKKANLLNQQFASVFSKDDLQSALPPAEQACTQ